LVKSLIAEASAPVIPPGAPPAGPAGLGAAIWAAEGVAGIGGAITIWAMLKFMGDVAVVVMALIGDVFTGVAVTVMSWVWGICWAGGCGAAAVSPLPATNPPSPSKSGGSLVASKRTVPPKTATKITWTRSEIVNSLEVFERSRNLDSKLDFFGDSSLEFFMGLEIAAVT
jgi:hypothetical protein